VLVVVLREEALADAARRDGEAVGPERDVAVVGDLDALDQHRVDLGLLDALAALDAAAQGREQTLGVAADADVVRDEVDRAALGRQRDGQGHRLFGELVLLEDLHAHAQHPVQRAVTTVRDPVAGALAQELPEHRLDRVDRIGLVDLSEVADDRLQPGRPVGLVLVLPAVRVRDDANVHAVLRAADGPGLCKKQAHRRGA
jgi:hypothetical protein